MTLPGDQNSEDSIRLLAAFSCEYSRAKHIRGLRLFVSVMLALSGPLVAHYFPTAENVRNYLAVAGGGWLLLSALILKRIEMAWIKRAAIIQEEFDSKVFGLPWNKMFVGDHISKELIRHTDAKYKCSSKRERLKNWYPDTDPIEYPINVLLCQRSNLVWDWRLRKSWCCFVGIITAGFFLVEICVAVATDQKLLDYILKFFTPSLAVLVLGIETAWANYDMAISKEKKEKTANSMLAQVKKDPASLTVDECRRLQDYIFSLRSKDPLVPNWWHRVVRANYDKEMRQAVQDFKNETLFS